MDWLKPKPEEIMVPCKKCGQKAAASSMKLDIDEKKMICTDCVKNKKIHKEIQEEVFTKKPKMEAEKPMVIQTKKIDAEDKPSKMGHKCSQCGYKFLVNIDTKSPKSCPYCNTRISSF